MRVLVVNPGSSSVKFELFEMTTETSLLEGEVEHVGRSRTTIRVETRDGSAPVRRAVEADDAGQATALALDAMSAAMPGSLEDLAAVGHRVVHGGDLFEAPVLLDDTVAESIASLARLAPLHTAAALESLRVARSKLPDAPHVAVFDTTFHARMPAHAREYALPRDLARADGIRRYGFHGTSHACVARRAAAMLGRSLEEVDLVTLHLGSGASAAAIRGGVSVDTSMGMTPLEGLVMGTRCGDLDPAIPMLLGEVTGRSREDVNRLLNNESGLLGLCGTSDMAEVVRRALAGEDDATLALDMYCYRVRKYVGAYAAALGRLDALVFTGGVGENSAEVRSRVCEGLGIIGVGLDEALNRAEVAGERAIDPEGAAVAVLVIPTDEEIEIARLALACVGGQVDEG